MPRELSLCRKWEKERRNRLNECFSRLGKVLPCYDPSINLSKVEILIKAHEHIEELQKKIATYLTEESENKPERTEIKQLYKRIKKLLTRNEQLSNLLKDAGISIPSECGIHKFTKRKKWSQKVTPEKAAILQKLESQKENDPKKLVKPKKKVVVKVKKKLPTKTRKSKSGKIVQKVSVQNLVTIASVQPCYLLANNLQGNVPAQTYSKAITVITNSNLLSTPILSTAVKTPAIVTKPNSFPTGTIILTNNIPMMQPPTLIAPPIIWNPPAPSNTILLVKSNKTKPSPSITEVTSTITTLTKTINEITKTYPMVMPKPSITKTTQINKVPIPASRYASDYIVVSNTLPSIEEKKITITQNTVVKKKVVKTQNKRKDIAKSNPECKKQKMDSSNKENLENKKSDYSITSLCQEKVDSTEKKEPEKQQEEKKDENATKEDPNKQSEVSVSTKLTENINIEPKKNSEEPLVSEKPTEMEITVNKPVELAQEISNLGHSELSNDIFASLQVPAGNQNPESTSPTAAFLNAFPLVSSFTGGKVNEAIEEETSDTHGTPTLLQIGTIETTKTIQTSSDSLTPSLINLESFSFFSKEICGNLYSSFETVTSNAVNISKTKDVILTSKTAKILYDNAISDTENLKSNQVKPNNRTPVTTVSTSFYSDLQNAVIDQQINITNSQNSNHKILPCNTDPSCTITNQQTSYKTERIPNSGMQVNTKSNILPDVNSEISLSCPIQKSTHNVAHMTNDLPLFMNQNNSLCNKNKINSAPVNVARNNLNLPKSMNLEVNHRQMNENSAMNNLGMNQMNRNSNLPNPSLPAVNPPSVMPHINTSAYQTENKNKTDKNNCSRYTNYNISEYNTFNPFTDLPKSSSVCTYNSTKTYNQSIYGSNTNCNYNYQTDFNTNYPVKNIGKGYTNYENYENPNQYNYYNQPIKMNKNKNDNVPRAPVNWMTAPDLKQQSTDFIVPSLGKEEFSYSQNSFIPNVQTTYFNSTPNTDFHNTFPESKKLDTTQFNNSFQRNEMEEHQFGWSPTKLPQLLDPPHGFVSNTLPTLVGDLALGNTNYSDKNKNSKPKDRRNQQNYDPSTNFLSVSQLAESAKITSRRNSGGRSKQPGKSNKRVNKNEKEISPNKPHQINGDGEWVGDGNKRIKHTSSSYSAEALIGHTMQLTNNATKPQNYSKPLPVPPPFLPDNLITYFPPVDIPPENNFNQQNQNYQTNFTFPTSIQNNTFIPNPTTTYLSSSNFMPEISEYAPIISDNIFSHSNQKTDNKQYQKKQNTKASCSNTPKKSKKKPTNDSTNFVDFSFLSMPGAINSPILPDDFHSHSNFLPPPPNPNQLYPCKNPLYPKQGTDLSGGLLPLPPVSRSNIQHPEVSPSLNNAGTSLTNFNLSTIFPEINKSSVPEMYVEPNKSKDYPLQRSYLPTTSQIPFTKTSMYNTPTTQSFSNS